MPFTCLYNSLSGRWQQSYDVCLRQDVVYISLQLVWSVAVPLFNAMILRPDGRAESVHEACVVQRLIFCCFAASIYVCGRGTRL